MYIVTEKERMPFPSTQRPSSHPGENAGRVRRAGGRLKFRDVTVGIEDRRNLAEVRSGLDGSERIALVPQAKMAKFKDGIKVRGTP